jgi:hypothetical protein
LLNWPRKATQAASSSTTTTVTAGGVGYVIWLAFWFVYVLPLMITFWLCFQTLLIFIALPEMGWRLWRELRYKEPSRARWVPLIWHLYALRIVRA